MKNKILFILAFGIAAAAFAYYAISPLFRNIKVNDATPALNDSNISATGIIVGTTGHPASGMVRIIGAGEKSYLRYEDFKTINGPDIYVYLAKDLAAKDFVNLGRVRATEGDVNYEVPTGVNAGEYRYALVWCKTFGVLFNYADLKANTSASQDLGI
jgi:hypothetical protein